MKPGEIIKSLRIKKGWGQTELAIHSGLYQNVISCIEKGKLELTISRARGIAEALGVPPSNIAFPEAKKNEF